MNVHRTAVVSDEAQIADDVVIGPYAVIGPQVVIGAGCVIHSHAVLEGRLEMGSGNTVGAGAVLGGTPQDLSFKPETTSSLRIGNGNVFREHCTIHRGTTEGSATVIGDRNYLMVGVHVAHNCRLGDGVIIANNVLLAGYVEIGDQAFIGGASLVHQYTHVGRLVITQGGSRVQKHLPPFVVAAERIFVFGLNVVGMRRAGFTLADRTEVKRAFNLLYRSGLNTRQAVEQAGTSDFGPLGREFFGFVAASQKRGIAPLSRGTDEED